jgi:hypothetical protein
MPYADDITGWVITPEDDNFHPYTSHPYETETFWTSWNHPERRMGGWFYNQVQPNQGEHGVCNGGAWVWDRDSDGGHVYNKNEHGIPMPPGPRDLRDITLPNGNTITMIEPLETYRVTAHDPGRFEADLVFDGVMEPNPHPAGCPPFWKGRHFDQAMHVTGEVVVNGDRLEIDCLSVRDRSWSPRPPAGYRRPVDPGDTPRQSRPKQTSRGYIFGTASANDAFLSYTAATEGEDLERVMTGYLIRDGVWAHLVEGTRTGIVDPDTGRTWRIEFEGTDTLGRTVEAFGEEVAGMLFYWKWNGAEGWGEDQSSSPPWFERMTRPPNYGVRILP